MSRPNQLLDDIYADYGAEQASFVHLLCDRHDPAASAVTIVGAGAVRRISYGELYRDSNRFANALLTQGIRPGDRVATLLRKGPELVTTMLAIWRIGAVYVPLFTAFAAPAAQYRLRAADVKLVVTDPEQRPKLVGDPDEPNPWRVIVVGAERADGDLRFEGLVEAASHAPVDPYKQGCDGPVVHMFTSGTTGQPKGVIHPLRYAAGWESYLAYGLGVTADDVYWCAADPGWAYGLYAAVVAPLAMGNGTILQIGAFNPAATWDAVADLSVTNFTAAPTVYRALRAATPKDARQTTLRRLSSAGEPLTPEVNAWARAALGLEVYDHYGQTEVGMVLANHHHPSFDRGAIEGSMGQPLPGWRVVVIGENDADPVDIGQPGRIAIDAVASPMMTFVSYQETAKTAARFTGDGRFYLLGDLGSVDAEGNFRFTSRDDDVIIMAGYRIGPFEVESAISQHPSVVECAVIGAPDPARGEVLEAYVVLADSVPISDDLTIEIQQIVKTKYAAHAYPRTVHVVDALPKTPSGKIQRFVLRERRRAELDTESPL